MIFLVIFFYSIVWDAKSSGVSPFTVLAFKSKHEACYYYVTSESTPKIVFALDLKSMMVREASCANEDYSIDTGTSSLRTEIKRKP